MILVLFVFLYVGIPLIYEKYSKYVLKKKVVVSQTFIFTFDDGPSGRLTQNIMDLLDKYDTKATFFLLGKNIQGYERIVRETVERGHEICSHGFEHLNYFKVSPWRALTDIKKGWNAIDTALGSNQGKYPFRPPYGKLNIVCLLYLLIKKVPIIYWTLDSGDTWKSKPDSNRIAVLTKNSGGAVSLFHDFNRSDEKKEFWVVESVQLALAAAKEKKMKVATVSEFI